jgi:hypothetical protein
MVKRPLPATSGNEDAANRRPTWLLGIYVQDEKRVLELVHNLHPPLPIWLKLAIQTLQSPASDDRRFMPGGMFIRQFLAYEIEFGAVVVDVEKVPRHGKASRALEQVPASSHAACRQSRIECRGPIDPLVGPRALPEISSTKLRRFSCSAHD